ncbi:MAG: GNAT family N-acetyltransferase [Nocardioides sp.]|nr:GNAT family N-acetyltransferase [Nocardioides sp.]
MQIVVDPVTDPRVTEFLAAHQRQLWEVTPNPETSSHALDLDGLRRPGVTVWTAWDDAQDPPALLGCAALAAIDGEPGHVELKSMRTDATRVRRGVATRLLLHVLDHARAAGHTRVSLETGSFAFFEPARLLYARHGFAECEPFGSYAPDPSSTFMTLAL